MIEALFRWVYPKRGSYTTLRGRIEFALYQTSERYQTWYRTERLCDALRALAPRG